MRYWADFNDIDENGRVFALREDRNPVVGTRLHLADHEGNSCWGSVASVEGDLLYVDPDWSTWMTVRDRHVVPQGWWATAGGFVAVASQGAVAGVRIDVNSESRNTGDAPVRVPLGV